MASFPSLGVIRAARKRDETFWQEAKEALERKLLGVPPPPAVHRAGLIIYQARLVC